MAIISDTEDPVIAEELRNRTSEELLHLRKSAIKLRTPRSYAIRLFIIKELLRRHAVLGEEIVGITYD